MRRWRGCSSPPAPSTEEEPRSPVKEETMTPRDRPSPLPALRPDDRLLLACARAHRDPGAPAEIREIAAEDPDWERFARQARRHGLVPLIYRNLHQAKLADAIPPPLFDELRMQYHRNSLRSHLMTGEALRLLGLLASAGIHAIAFKGPVLAKTAYGSTGLRVSSDLDILVKRDEIEKALEVLGGSGYREIRAFSPEEKRLHFKKSIEIELKHEEEGWELDLHWVLNAPFITYNFDDSLLWSRAARAVINGKEVLTLSPGDYLLYHSKHGVNHFWDRLILLCDVAEILSGGSTIDWPWLMGEAARGGNLRMLLLSFSMARDLLGAPLPAAVEAHIKADRKAGRLARYMYGYILSEEPVPNGFVERRVFKIRVREKLRDRAGYVLHYLGTPEPEDLRFVPGHHAEGVRAAVARTFRYAGAIISHLAHDLGITRGAPGEKE